MTKLAYPAARIDNVVERAAARELSDPYRWLEADTDETRQWQQVQAQLAQRQVQTWPGYNALCAQIETFLVNPIETVPHFAGQHWFRIEKGRVIMAATPYGEGETIYALLPINKNSNAVLYWICPSPNARIVAMGVCEDGSEHNRIYLIDVETKTLLPHAPHPLLKDYWTGGVTWLLDSSGFYFSALVSDPSDAVLGVYSYCIASAHTNSEAVPLPDTGAANYMITTLCDTGRYHIVHQGIVMRPVAILDTAQPNARWSPFITQDTGAVIGRVLGDHLYAITYVDASCGRMIVVPLNSDNPDDSLTWKTLVDESAAVMRSITTVGELLYLHELVDSYSRVRIFDTTGTEVGTVALPKYACINEGLFSTQHLATKGHPDEFLFSYSTFTQSWSVCRHVPHRSTIETLLPAVVSIDNAVIEDHWVVSKDGTQIPFHCVRLADTEPSQPQPSLLFAYGAFNLPCSPQYPGAIAAFIAAGGVYLHAHIRGGGEFGMDWWQTGRGGNKQNGYDDLYAIAEYWIDQRRTTRKQLALTGRSNGGLMCGVALTQRPDLWRVVVPQVPIFDLIGAIREPYTRHVIDNEFSDPAVSEHNKIEHLLTFSPYHLIKIGVDYPAVYIVAGGTDTRCRPWHARKLTACLQAANSGEHPVLLSIWDDAGHGQATARNIELAQYSQWLAFILMELGMDIKTENIKRKLK
jgi:prolyl oligopeptidase